MQIIEKYLLKHISGGKKSLYQKVIKEASVAQQAIAIGIQIASFGIGLGVATLLDNVVLFFPTFFLIAIPATIIGAANGYL